jgi:hypothetical protein
VTDEWERYLPRAVKNLAVSSAIHWYKEKMLVSTSVKKVYHLENTKPHLQIRLTLVQLIADERNVVAVTYTHLLSESRVCVGIVDESFKEVLFLLDNSATDLVR